MAKRVKHCMACKTAQTDHPSCICKDCRDKACSNCGKISVANTQFDDNGIPYCPKCFRMVIQLAIKSNKTDSLTLAQRLDIIESDITMIRRDITRLNYKVFGSETKQSAEDRPTSNQNNTIARRRDYESLDKSIDSALESMSLPDVEISADDIKNRVLEMFEDSKSVPDTSEDK